MKKFTYITLLCILCSTYSFAQDDDFPSYGLNLTDLGILFSQENNIGDARFTALNGAMGAVGGNLSTININPAGAAVFNNSEFSFTVGNHNYDNESTYYGTTTSNTSSSFNFDQIGAVFVFKDNYSYGGWKKINVGINYQITNRFNKIDFYQGNSGYARFIGHPLETENGNYLNVLNQEILNIYTGHSSKLTFSLAGEYDKKFYLGGALHFHSLNFNQRGQINDESSDENGIVLGSESVSKNNHNSEGISIGAGIIYKASPSVRLGAAIESPTWYYNTTEDYYANEFFNEIPEKGVGSFFDERNFFLKYQLRTPAKATLSSAFVFGKTGFINIDYTYKTFKSLEISGDDLDLFLEESEYFASTLQNTSNLNIGGETRFKNISLRAGVGFKQSPFKSNIDPGIINVLKIGDSYSGSLGIGMRFGNSKIDLSYRITEQTNEYDFNDALQGPFSDANSGNVIESVKVKNNNSHFGISYTYIF